MKHLTHPDTAILICFSCARKFPCLHASKENPIRRYRIENNNNRKDVSTPSRFFGMSKESALDISGLARLCTRYVTDSDNVIFTEDDEEIDDWHLLIKFDNEPLKT